jgi:methionine-rich copper-binding protein CopC
MQARAVVLSAALMLAPLTAWAADLVVWWEESHYPAEDAAVHELIAAFEAKTSRKVELVRHDLEAQTTAVQTAIDAGRPSSSTSVRMPRASRSSHLSSASACLSWRCSSLEDAPRQARSIQHAGGDVQTHL